MKKVLLFIAIATLATLAQAASFNWSSGNYSLIDSDGNKLTAYAGGGQVVLALLGNEADFSDATVLQSATPSTASKTAGRMTNTYEFSYDTSLIENGDTLAVLYKDSNGNLLKLLDASGAGEMYTTYVVEGLGNNSWSGKQYNFATSNFQEPIPEPTSGFLLIVGASLLALRRKQK